MNNPYINLKSYTESNAHNFKGRDNEIEDILAILKRSDIVILYSESAEGKSSLLGAGLSPRFRQMGYIPINIVFTDEEFKNLNPDFDKIVISRIHDVFKSANERICKDIPENDLVKTLSEPNFYTHSNESELYQWVSTSDVDIPSDNIAANKLTSNVWWLLRNFAVERYAAQFHFVLIFDQFEEVFSHPNLDWIDSLFKWLENLYSDKCPESVSEALLEIYHEEELVPSFNLNRSFKEIFSMRNEYIGDLDYWGVQRHFMPELKNYRYCLKPLTLKEASEVVDLGFKNDPEIKTQILAAVSGVSMESINSLNTDLPRVQAMLLSVVCSALCESESEKQNDNIKALKIGNSEAIQKIVYDVYRQQLDEIKISNSDRIKIEEALIDNNGKRVRIKTSTPVLKGINFDTKYKNSLKRHGIIKSSKINGEDYVELVHDQLALAINRHDQQRTQSKRAILSLLSVALVCIIVFAMWINSGMHVNSSQIETTKHIDKYSLAVLDDNEPYKYSISGGSLENNPIVQTYTIDTIRYYTTIKNNENLKTLLIKPHSSDDISIIEIDGNINLKKIVVLDSVRNLVLNINDNNGFCQVDLGKDTKNIIIRPRSEYLEIKSVDPSYKWVDNRLWNLNDSSITYIPYDINYDKYFIFPLSLDSIKYNNSIYYSYPLDGILDLSSKYNLRSIPYSKFKNGSFTSVILPQGLKEIGSVAFQNCSNLKQIIIPATVNSIAYDAFDEKCEVLFERGFNKDEVTVENDSIIKDIKIPQRRGTLDLSKFTEISEIGYNALRECKYDTIILPPNLKVIHNDAFQNCKNLKQINIPASVTFIADNAFDDGCEVLFERGFNKDEVTVENDSIIKDIKIPQRRGTLDLSNFTEISKILFTTFGGCRYDTIILPPNLKDLITSKKILFNCKNLKILKIPSPASEFDYSSLEPYFNLVSSDKKNQNIICRKSNVLDFRKNGDKDQDLRSSEIKFDGIDSILLSNKIESFSCDSIEHLIYIGNDPLSKLIKFGKFIKIGSNYYKFPLHYPIHRRKIYRGSPADNIVQYKGTYSALTKPYIFNGANRLKDVYYIGIIPFKSKVISYVDSIRNIDGVDSILKFDDKSQLSKIESIHLSLPQPRIWTIKNDTAKMSYFSIDLPDSIKTGITLYVPYKSKRFYEEDPNFKAFKEIREESLIKRCKDIIFVRMYGVLGWFSVPSNVIITVSALFVIIIVFFFSYKKHYAKEHSYASSIRVNVLSAINGFAMGIIAILGFVASYWWIWDLTNHNYFFSVICGSLGTVCALGLCYFKIFPYIISFIGRLFKKSYNAIKKLIR